MREKPTREDLRAAIDELLADKPVSIAQTDSIGCIIGRAREAKADELGDVCPRYRADPARAMRRSCHRDGEIGPFELTSYEEAAGWGEMIAEVVRERRMPPWHADPKHGTFANDRSMPSAEKELIYQWVKNGCPEGESGGCARASAVHRGLAVAARAGHGARMEQPFTVPADAGRDGVRYQHFKVPTGFTEDKWIAAMEVQPGNRAVVHHTIVYVAPPGKRRRDDFIFLSAYVPGLRFDPLPPESAKRIPAGSTLVFEMHYTPNGTRARGHDANRTGVCGCRRNRA